MILSSASPASVVLGIATVAAYALQAAAASRKPLKYAQGTLLVAWLLHGLALAWSMLGGSPRFGFAPALSITAWLVLTVYAVESQVFPLLKARWALALLGAAAVLLALFFPGKPLHVSASAWLRTVTSASYAPLAAARSPSTRCAWASPANTSNTPASIHAQDFRCIPCIARPSSPGTAPGPGEMVPQRGGRVHVYALLKYGPSR